MRMSLKLLLGAGLALSSFNIAAAQDAEDQAVITDQKSCEALDGMWFERADGDYCMATLIDEDMAEQGIKGIQDCGEDNIIEPQKEDGIAMCWYPVNVIELKTEVYKDADGNIIENPEEVLGSGVTEVVEREISEDEIPEGAKVITLEPGTETPAKPGEAPADDN